MDNNYLAHHGVKGMKWGVRRYENEDGTLTPAGKRRYAKLQRKWEKNVSRTWVHAYNRAAYKSNKGLDEFNSKYGDVSSANPEARRKYIKDYANRWNDIYTKELESTFGKPVIDDGRAWCDRVFGFMDPDDDYE